MGETQNPKQPLNIEPKINVLNILILGLFRLWCLGFRV
jgi:hypothetical protein